MYITLMTLCNNVTIFSYNSLVKKKQKKNYDTYHVRLSKTIRILLNESNE